LVKAGLAGHLCHGHGDLEQVTTSCAFTCTGSYIYIYIYIYIYMTVWTIGRHHIARASIGSGLGAGSLGSVGMVKSTKSGKPGKPGKSNPGSYKLLKESIQAKTTEVEAKEKEPAAIQPLFTNPCFSDQRARRKV
jgi:tellurite resistance protein TehA-like permease